MPSKNFLSNICESFIVDHELYDKVSQRNLYNNISSLLDDMFLSENKIYNDFTNKSLLYQQQVIYEYFILCENLITNFFIVTTLIWLFSPLQRFSGKLVDSIIKTMTNVGKYFQKLGHKWTFQKAILDKNAKSAYIECGVDPKEISTIRNMKALFSKRRLERIHHKKGIQLDCLKEVYIIYFIEQLVLVTKSFLECLKNTKKYESLKLFTSSSNEYLFPKINISTTCSEVYSYVKEMQAQFDELLNLCYPDDENKKQEKVNILMKKLSDLNKQYRKF